MCKTFIDKNFPNWFGSYREYMGILCRSHLQDKDVLHRLGQQPLWFSDVPNRCWWHRTCGLGSCWCTPSWDEDHLIISPGTSLWASNVVPGSSMVTALHPERHWLPEDMLAPMQDFKASRALETPQRSKDQDGPGWAWVRRAGPAGQHVAAMWLGFWLANHQPPSVSIRG